MADRTVRHPRTTVLTDKARRALGLPDARDSDLVLVPLLDLPMRDDAKDRRWAR